MQHRTRSPSWRHHTALASSAAAVAAVAAIALLPARPGASAAGAGDGLSAAAEGAMAAPPQADPAVRRECLERDPATSAPAQQLDFAATVEELRRLGDRTAALAQDDEFEAARQNDQQTRQLFAALLAAFPDAGERALALLVAQSPGDHEDHAPAAISAPASRGRNAVAALILRADLDRRHRRAASGDPGSLDSLVLAILAAMPAAPAAAQIGAEALAEQPYLGLAHEAAVHALLAQVDEQRIPRSVATRLLATLWRNVVGSGQRPAAAADQLALLDIDAADPSRRAVACRHLLGDQRYRALVLAMLRAQPVPELAGELAATAAAELPAGPALQALRELAPLLPSATGAYLALGARAPDALIETYGRLLAADQEPAVRRDLVAGLALLPGPAGQEFAALAFAHDPAPEVRLQALFTLTIGANRAAAARAIHAALDDPAATSRPERLEAIVLALHNLAVDGDPNLLAPLVHRLRAMPLDAAGRQRLEQLASQHLPGGG